MELGINIATNLAGILFSDPGTHVLGYSGILFLVSLLWKNIRHGNRSDKVGHNFVTNLSF